MKEKRFSPLLKIDNSWVKKVQEVAHQRHRLINLSPSFNRLFANFAINTLTSFQD